MAALPPALETRARDFIAAGPSAAVAPARDAATVVLLADTVAGPEVYLLRRASTMAFAAGMHVFPGGSVDARDAESVDALVASGAWVGPAPSVWAGWLGCTERLAGALVLAAVRETFEESGILLAAGTSGSVTAASGDAGRDAGRDDDVREIERSRLALLDRSLAMSEVLRRHGLVLRADLVRPYSHWITPEFEPKRFDTRFFLAAVPPGQRPRDVSGEADATLWLPLGEAVARHEAGVLAMLPPTIEALRDLATFPTVADALAAPRVLRPILPRLVVDGDRLSLTIEDAL